MDDSSISMGHTTPQAGPSLSKESSDGEENAVF